VGSGLKESWKSVHGSCEARDILKHETNDTWRFGCVGVGTEMEGWARAGHVASKSCSHSRAFTHEAPTSGGMCVLEAAKGNSQKRYVVCLRRELGGWKNARKRDHMAEGLFGSLPRGLEEEWSQTHEILRSEQKMVSRSETLGS
jgi:hypothetical protein